jgi:hypothetical protein
MLSSAKLKQLQLDFGGQAGCSDHSAGNLVIGESLTTVYISTTLRRMVLNVHFVDFLTTSVNPVLSLFGMSRQQSHPYPTTTTFRNITKHRTNSSTNPYDDWAKISDKTERRRIQNRIAQRNYRKRLSTCRRAGN